MSKQKDVIYEAVERLSQIVHGRRETDNDLPTLVAGIEVRVRRLQHEANLAKDGAEDVRAALAEAHQLLDAAGIPPAHGQPCENPDCQSHIGHRIRDLLEEREWLQEGIDLLYGIIDDVHPTTRNLTDHVERVVKLAKIAVSREQAKQNLMTMNRS